MFGQSKPVPYEPYGRRRSRGRVPSWLVLLVSGIAIGAAGVLVVQERYLPPRLSASASADLHSSFEQADVDRLRLKQELGETAQRLQAALGDQKGLADELDASRAATERLRDDVAAVITALPPDPRGGAVEVRAGRFVAKGNALAYDLVLTRERAAAGKPIPAVLQLVVAGESARGGEAATTLKPVTLSIGAHEIVRGSLPLPDGFKPNQVTVQVLDRVGGRGMGMRVMLIK